MTEPPSEAGGAAGVSAGTTPSQTVGPYLAIGLPWADGPDVVAAGTPHAVTLVGTLLDGAGDPVPDGLVEIWGADPAGRFAQPDAPGRSTGFRGFGRCPTDADGRFRFRTLVPGPLPAPDLGEGAVEAPHLDVSVFARGLLHRVVTRVYFPDRPENATDPVLAGLDPVDRDALVAVRDGDALRFDIRLQDGPTGRETPFFEL